MATETESPSSESQARTRDRILSGAVSAIAHHGLAKLRMSDVSRHAGLSRASVYRYFPSREKLLEELVGREADRFRQHLLDELEGVVPEERMRVALEHAERLTREHPVLQRVLETDSAFVLAVIREQLPVIRAAIHDLLAPVLRDSSLVQSGVATTSQLVDWTTRIMIFAYLFPDPHPGAMAESMAAIQRLLVVKPEQGGSDEL